MAGLFIRWLDEYTHLEDAGYITVALVGFKLLVRALAPDFQIPEAISIIAIALIFIWAFPNGKKQKNCKLS